MARSSNWSRQAQSDEDFTRAAYDLLRDIERSTYSKVRIELRADLQRGVWEVYSMVLVEREEGRQEVLCGWSGYYPNSRAASFAAYLFAHMNTLAQMAGEAYNTWQKWGGRAA